MNAIVAVDQNWAIGKNGDQLVYLKEDLKRFRTLTSGHTVILGRKTLATFPGGKPLKNRENLILSRNPDFQPQGCQVFRDIPALLNAAPSDSFVIGGGSVYQALLDACDTVYVTRIDAAFRADTWFPNLDDHPDWEIAETSQPLEQDGLVYRYVTYRRKETGHVPG